MALTRPKYSQIYDTDYKQSVRVATTGDVGTLLVAGGAPNSVDTVTLILNDRILVKDQTASAQNGIYRVTVVGTGVNGTWIRDHDADASDKVTSGLTTTVAEGATNISRTYKLITPDPIVLETTLLTFVNPFATGAAIGTDTQISFNTAGTNAGAASLHYFTGNGVVLANAGVASSSTTTGTLQVTGGIGASGNINASNIIAINSTLTGVATVAGVLYANATTASTTYTDGGLVVAGGVGIAGNVHIQSGKILHVGPDLIGAYSNVLAQFNANVNSYTQVLLQNISSGTSASSDYICVADTGTDSINYIDHGINSSNYSDVAYTIGTGLDGYSYTNGGNYAIGTQTAGKGLIFHTGGTLSANKRVTINDTGLTVNTATVASSISTGALVVNGGVGVAGHLWVGGNLYVTNVISSSTQTVSSNAPLLYLVSSASYPYNYDLGFYSAFTGGPANVYAHTGMIRNDADSTWYLFSNVAEPTGGQVSLTNAIYDPLSMGALTINGTSVTGTGGTAIVNAGTSGQGNIGTASATFNTVYAQKLQGVIQTASHPLITTLGGVTSIGASGSTTLTGILQTAAQTNITSVGTLTSLAVTGNINAGNVAATYFSGNGSLLTGLIAGPIYTANTAPPSSPRVNDIWYDTATDITFSYVNDGDSSQWVDVSSAALNNGIITGTSVSISGNGVISGTLSSGALTVPNIIHSGTSGTGDIGGTGAAFGTVYATATSAQYADLAEKYTSDSDYSPGTVLIFGGAQEVTVSVSSHNPAVAGVVTTNPAYLMNDSINGVAVALTGRVPCQVRGPVNKGDRLVSSSTHGTAQRLNMSEYTPGCIIGKSLETIETNEIKLIEVAIGRF